MLVYHVGATIDHSLLERAVEYDSHSIIRFLLEEYLIVSDASVSWNSSMEQMRSPIESLKISLEYRQRNGPRKVCSPPLPIDDHQQEFQPIDELERIINDRDRMSLQFFLMQRSSSIIKSTTANSPSNARV